MSGNQFLSENLNVTRTGSQARGCPSVVFLARATTKEAGPSLPPLQSWVTTDPSILS
jgi:hypothetical protein